VIDEEGKVGDLSLTFDADDPDQDGTTDAVLLEIHFISRNRDLVLDRSVTADRIGDPTVNPDCN
jgi:hypothetical protein